MSEFNKHDIVRKVSEGDDHAYVSESFPVGTLGQVVKRQTGTAISVTAIDCEPGRRRRRLTLNCKPEHWEVIANLSDKPKPPKYTREFHSTQVTETNRDYQVTATTWGDKTVSFTVDNESGIAEWFELSLDILERMVADIKLHREYLDR